MTTMLILIILLILVGYGLKEYYQLKLGKPISSTSPVIDELVEFLSQYGSSGRFIDMGSGWGTLVLALAKRLPDWQIDGIEASPTPWFIANVRSIGKSFSNYRFFIGDMEKHVLQGYDIVFLYQSQRRLAAMLPRLVKTLQNDTFILSYPNPIPRLPDPNVLLTDAKQKIYLYAGIDALVPVQPAEPVPVSETSPVEEPVVEPAQDVPPPPAVEPNDDNAFEQLPHDEAPPLDSIVEPHQVTNDDLIPANEAVPADMPAPNNDYPEQDNPPRATD